MSSLTASFLNRIHHSLVRITRVFVMNAFRLSMLAVVAVLLAFPVAASHGYVMPYGGFGSEYERSRTSESVTVHESESYSSSSDYGGYRNYHSSDNYDYGRSRDFSFSRTEDYERESSYGSHGYRPYGDYVRGYSSYSYPYYDVGTSYGVDYRPFSDYYSMSRNSPYYDPYRYSRVGAYESRYLPYGY